MFGMAAHRHPQALPILRFRHDHAVDHMDDTVRCVDVSLCDNRVVHLDGVAAGIDPHLAALHGLGVCRLPLEVTGHNIPGHDVIGPRLRPDSPRRAWRLWRKHYISRSLFYPPIAAPCRFTGGNLDGYVRSSTC